MSICLLSSSQTSNTIQSIQKQYQQTNKNLKSYKQKTINREDISTEGGTATFYSSKDSLKLIKETIYGEMGQSEVLFYMNDTMHYFILENETKYNRPLYDSLRSDKLSVKNTCRYYFQNNKMIKSINYSKTFGIDRILIELKALIAIYKNN